MTASAITRRAAVAGLTATLGLAATGGCATSPTRPIMNQRPVIIAHRGASGERPEHTLAAYRLAIQQGADFIEPDLVPTRDGHLVARHENEIGGTTDVAEHPRFADRRTTKQVDGEAVTGWFTEDFTLEELKTLRCRERLPQLRPGNTAFNDQETIPTFQEVIALAQEQGRALGRTIGVYPETKHPTYFEALGLAFDRPLLEALEAAGWNRAGAPVFIQSFETRNLQRLRSQTPVALVQLMDASGGPADGTGLAYRDMASAEGLTAVRRYANGIGPNKTLVIPRDPTGRSLPASPLVRGAHALGLVVHPWTFRAENMFLATELRRGDPADPAFQRLHGDLATEIAAHLAAGVDGLFCDFPLAGVTARDSWLQTEGAA